MLLNNGDSFNLTINPTGNAEILSLLAVLATYYSVTMNCSALC